MGGEGKGKVVRVLSVHVISNSFRRSVEETNECKKRVCKRQCSDVGAGDLEGSC